MLGFWLFCLFDVITTDESQVRNLSKLWWVVIVLLFVVVGSVMWLVAGRPQGAGAPRLPSKGGGTAGGSRYAVAGGWSRPADRWRLTTIRSSSRACAGSTTEDKDMLQRWEDDLRRREEELRKRSEQDPAEDDS